ncbi:IS256 family transposase [Paenibacillus ferrarius]|uniref:IS256 family transposase n=1 Tax=Paenibacillus ferrarius TaxID=1469647 RepID=UPI003D289D16
MTTIPQMNLNDLLENLVKNMVQEKLEFLMKEEMNQFLQVEEQTNIHNSRNGYYGRTLDTRYGKIEDLRVPRDRNGNFQTQLFEPYQRRDGWLEEAVIHMYKGGMSTRDVARFIEGMFGTQYSPATISNITSTVLEDVQRWQERPLEKRYSVIYLDGFYFNLKRDSVDSEVVYLAMGINEQGYRHILGFYIGGKESANGWREVLADLKRRGATEVLLGVFDGLSGLEDAFKEAYPKADVQHCVVHKVRNTFSKIRVKDKSDFMDDLKTIYTAPDLDIAKACFDTMKAKWGKLYPKEIESWESNLPTLLTFYNYPTMIRKAIYTSNPIERTNKEFRKRLRPMNSLTNLEAAEKIIYLDTIAYNERWGNRVIAGFNDPKTKEALAKLFEKKYPALLHSEDHNEGTA